VSNLDLASFEILLPSLETLVELYGIDPPVAFHLWRPILAHKTKQYEADEILQLQKQKLLKGLASSEKSANFQENEKSSTSTPDHGIDEISSAPENEGSDPEESKQIITPFAQLET
jgi:hypothetical protein